MKTNEEQPEVSLEDLKTDVLKRFPESFLFNKDEWFVVRFSFKKENIALGNWKHSEFDAWLSADKCLTGKEKLE